MKRVLLDHCVPKRIRLALANCEVVLTKTLGWEELTNGELLAAAEAAGFHVFVTADKNLRYQQNLTERRIAIVLLPTNHLPELLEHFSEFGTAVSGAAAGVFVKLTFQ